MDKMRNAHALLITLCLYFIIFFLQVELQLILLNNCSLLLFSDAIRMSAKLQSLATFWQVVPYFDQHIFKCSNRLNE